MKPLLLPMLARPAAPFDAEDYLFEVKWDGVRALAASEAGGHWRLWGRKATDYTRRYPELAVLARLPAGTVVDGELVVLDEGRADFPALLRRHQRQEPNSFGVADGRQQPAVSYVLFDLLFAKGQSLLKETLVQRRARLQELLGRLQEPIFVYSDSVVGCGQEFFAQVVAQGHEGVMAKKQASRYLPGKRSPAWRKIKPRGLLPCVIVGYRAGRAGVERLLVASVRKGVLSYVGQVCRGLSRQTRVVLAGRLAAFRRAQPVVSCPQAAYWVEPELYCSVQFASWSNHGHLRHALFGGLLENP